MTWGQSECDNLPDQNREDHFLGGPSEYLTSMDALFWPLAVWNDCLSTLTIDTAQVCAPQSMMVKGEAPASVQCAALRALGQVLASIDAVPPSDAKIFSECALRPKFWDPFHMPLTCVCLRPHAALQARMVGSLCLPRLTSL